MAQWSVTNPSFIAFGFGSVWVPDHHGNTITRIDPATNTVAAVIKGTGNLPEDALEVGDRLWVTGQADDTVLIDPSTNTVTKTIKGDRLYMDAGFGSVWITTRDNHLDRLDPVTAAVTASIPVRTGDCDCMNDVVVTSNAAWVISCDTGMLIKVDPNTNMVASRTSFGTLMGQGQAHAGATVRRGTDSIWIPMTGDEGGGGSNGLVRVDPETGQGSAWLPLTPDQTGDGFIAVTDDAVWLGGTEQYSRVDVATDTISATYPTSPGWLKLGVLSVRSGSGTTRRTASSGSTSSRKATAYFAVTRAKIASIDACSTVVP
jgi:streptogramin lyase